MPWRSCACSHVRRTLVWQSSQRDLRELGSDVAATSTLNNTRACSRRQVARVSLQSSGGNSGSAFDGTYLVQVQMVQQ